jgi:dipeptidase E
MTLTTTANPPQSATDLRLMLLSNSSMAGQSFLEYCLSDIRTLLRGIQNITFVPYALSDHQAYTRQVQEAFATIEVRVQSLHDAPDPRQAVRSASAIFVGGGNTFVLLKELYDRALVEPLRWRALDGIPYIGSSAGANIAGVTIQTTNDMPIVYPPSLRALELVSFNVNPHYIDRSMNVGSGESRDARIAQFHEYNDIPVVALPEGSFVIIENGSTVIRGGGHLFKRGSETQKLANSQPLDSLLTKTEKEMTS